MIGNMNGNNTLGSLFEERVKLYGKKQFIVFESKEGKITQFTYEEFNIFINRFAHGLTRIGVKQYDKVIVHMTNCPEFVMAWFALAKLGAIIVPTNTYSTWDELDYIIRYSDASCVITEHKYSSMFGSHIGNYPKIRNVIICKDPPLKEHGFLFSEDVMADEAANPGIAVLPGDISEILFTSGTTARPKGALLSHEGAVFQGKATGYHLWMSPNDRVIIFLPLFHVNGQMLTLVPTMAFGGTVILIEEYSASKFMRQIRKHKATFTCIVPTILRTLLKQPKMKNDNKHYMRSSFYALPTSKEEWEEFENRFNIKLIDGYGLTETFALAIGNPYWGLRKRHCIGLPAVGMEVRLIDENGETIEKCNQPGEILLKGSPIFSGYYKNEEETKKAVDEAGWLHTGDIGYMDPDGYYYFYDRKKEIIKRAGENISTSEVERVLNDHVDIMESAVVGVPDEMRDEAVFAFVVVKNNNLSADDIRNYCREKMSSFKVPQYVNIIDQFEKTSIGKIKKNKYKDIAKNIYKSLT